jgi:hypothetical protein
MPQGRGDSRFMACVGHPKVGLPGVSIKILLLGHTKTHAEVLKYCYDKYISFYNLSKKF